MAELTIGDHVTLGGIDYRISPHCLINELDSNDQVFENLGLDKVKFCKEAYGYEPNGGNWPEYNENDMGAANRVIKKLLELTQPNFNPTFMTSLKEKFKVAFLKEPEKSFRKAQITNGDDFLTEDGIQVFLGWLLKKHGNEFKTEVVDDLLKEEEKK